MGLNDLNCSRTDARIEALFDENTDVALAFSVTTGVGQSTALSA